MRNTPYALRTYLQTYDNTVSKYVPLDLFPDQVTLIEDYDQYNENIALKYRQAGVSTVTAAWASKRLVFAKKQKPEKILIIANKLDTSVEFANKVRGFTEQWPAWVGVGFSAEKNSQRHFKLTNDCEVKAVATSKDALRGYTPTILIFDEAAFIEADDDFWSACMASLSTGGKVIVISTPNGYDPIYYDIYNQALRGMNEFKISEMFWHRDPRYTKDLYMVKTKDIVHFLLNREDYPSDATIDLTVLNPYERNHEVVTDYIKQGYKPCSSWFEGMVKKLKFDRRKVAQELECNFLGSGDNVFDSNLMDNIMKNMLREPQAKLMGASLWIFKEPENSHKYVMGVDVSRGDSEDFSCIQIIDFDEREQVLEYVGKVPPDVIAEIAYKWGSMYNAYCVVDITGGMGVATSRKLQEMNYKNLYIDGINTKNIWEYNSKAMEKIPGLSFNNKRTQIVAAFEEQLRKGFAVRSSRLLNELNTFVYLNGRPDHMKGTHDDAIMGLSMALYVADMSFNQLEKNENANKAMLDSWTMSERTYEPNKSFYSYGTAFDQIGSMGMDNNQIYYQNNPSGVPKEAYKEYSWLFGKSK